MHLLYQENLWKSLEILKLLLDPARAIPKP